MAKDKKSKKVKSPKVVAVACAFCGARIPYTDSDPISLGVVEHWRPYEEQPDWSVYAHRECLMSRLDPEARDGIDSVDGA